MALFDDVLNGGNFVAGLVVGAGALIVWPLVGPVLRPLAKTAIKGGLVAYREAERLYNDATAGITAIAQEAQQEMGTTVPTQVRAHAGGSHAT